MIEDYDFIAKANVLYTALGFICFVAGIMIYRFIKDSVVAYMQASITVNPYLNGVYYAVDYWTERGGRQYQEDRFSMSKGSGHIDSSLYGLYDGHGGAKASEYCKKYLLNYIENDESFAGDTITALTKGFERLDTNFTAIARRHMLNDGTTAVVAVINNRTVYVANLGDSRAIIVQKGL